MKNCFIIELIGKLRNLIEILIICVLINSLSTPAYSKVRLPMVIGDNMVLQRELPIRIWGWADPQERVTIKIADIEQITATGNDGKWTAIFQPMGPGGPYQVTIKGSKNTIVLNNILIGDVWICSGQSNMEWPLSKVNYSSHEIIRANYPDIRLFTVNRNPSPYPADDVDSEGWKVCTSDNARNFSAMAYFFGREINRKTNVPIGLISSNYGGTSAQAWTSAEALNAFPEFKPEIDEMTKNSGFAKEKLKKLPDEIKNWNNQINLIDPGSIGKNPAWAELNLDVKDWKMMNLPCLWEDSGLKDFDGIVWFRKEIIIPKELVSKDLKLSLSTIDDMDVTWFNGTLVGSTDSYDKFRVYKIPAKIIKEGKNVITIRVIDTRGGGGIYGNPENLVLSDGRKNILLSGDWLYKVSKNYKDLPKYPQNENQQIKATSLYNGMIAPITNFSVKGTIWYQGEANVRNAHQYRSLFPVMINDWRKKWKNNMPFLFVQLANFNSKGSLDEGNWPLLRESQARTLGISNTGMVVTIDIGDAKDIHPRNKQEVGRRLALTALGMVYKERLVFQGPTYDTMKIENNRIRILFKNTGSGLMTWKNDVLKNFIISGIDKKFVNADAFIDGNSVIVTSDQVLAPIAVRYAWSDSPEDCNLYNIEGLPAVPFRTDVWDEVLLPVEK